jgi:hypothetical protein
MRSPSQPSYPQASQPIPIQHHGSQPNIVLPRDGSQPNIVLPRDGSQPNIVLPRDGSQPNIMMPPSSPALAAVNAPIPGTRLGVGAPPRPQHSQSLRASQTGAPPLETRPSKLWIFLGALLAIAAGIGLALAIVRAT